SYRDPGHVGQSSSSPGRSRVVDESGGINVKELGREFSGFESTMLLCRRKPLKTSEDSLRAQPQCGKRVLAQRLQQQVCSGHEVPAAKIGQTELPMLMSACPGEELGGQLRMARSYLLEHQAAGAQHRAAVGGHASGTDTVRKQEFRDEIEIEALSDVQVELQVLAAGRSAG